MGDKVAKVELGGQASDYKVLSGTVGPDVIDIRKLYGNTGAFTYDPGFTSTATRASSSTAAIRSTSWPNNPTSWR
jgi:citrate synthase